MKLLKVFVRLLLVVKDDDAVSQNQLVALQIVGVDDVLGRAAQGVIGAGLHHIYHNLAVYNFHRIDLHPVAQEDGGGIDEAILRFHNVPVTPSTSQTTLKYLPVSQGSIKSP